MVLSDADVHEATGSIALIAGLRKAFEEKRKEYTAPLNLYLKDINASFREYTDPLDRAEKLVKGRVLTFDNERKAIIRAREEANRLNEEAAQREMQFAGELSQPVGLVEVPPAPPQHYRTAAGDLGKATIKKWEVEDINLVPIEYLMIDAAKVGKVVRAGIPSIPGIRIYLEEILKVSMPRG